MLANIYWASAKPYFTCITSSPPPSDKPKRQALLWSHFTEEEAERSDWVKAWVLVITIICPLATPKEVTVTQQLHKNVSRQATAAEAGAFLEVESKEIPSFTGMHFCVPHACVLLRCNLHTPFTNVVLFQSLTDMYIQPLNRRCNHGDRWFVFSPYSFAFFRISCKWIVHFFHWTCAYLILCLFLEVSV